MKLYEKKLGISIGWREDIKYYGEDHRKSIDAIVELVKEKLPIQPHQNK